MSIVRRLTDSIVVSMVSPVIYSVSYRTRYLPVITFDSARPQPLFRGCTRPIYIIRTLHAHPTQPDEFEGFRFFFFSFSCEYNRHDIYLAVLLNIYLTFYSCDSVVFTHLEYTRYEQYEYCRYNTEYNTGTSKKSEYLKRNFFFLTIIILYFPIKIFTLV